MKVIFLDIDGVLNHQLFYENRHRLDDLPYPLSEFDSDCVERLNKIVELTNAKIIISSSWRFKPGIFKILYEVGIDGDIIGKTEYIVTPTEDGFKHEIRGVEIQEYLDTHKDIDRYVIFDDDSDMLDNQMPYYIQTSWYDGLNDVCMNRAISILNM